MSVQEVSINYLGYSIQELESNGGIHTAREISGQPDLWLDTYQLVLSADQQLNSFLKGAYKNQGLEIILTGAGTSAFIGNVLQGPFQKNSGQKTRAIATTDLVSHPEEFFQKNTATLLISFARSGNSPESVAAVNLANSFCKNIFHLIITCNPEGRLAKDFKNHPQSFVFLLPPEADDKSLAMTGSFSAMLLTGLLISRIDKLPDQKGQIEQLSRYGTKIIKTYKNGIRGAAKLNFQRAIFLGSGPLKGTAEESHLKLQELTDGKVICKHDSFLGFRHGPKAVVDPSSLLIYLFSNNKHVLDYEVDLVKAINAGEKGIYRIGICEKLDKSRDLNEDINLMIELSEPTDSNLDEEFLSVCSVLPAQMLGFYKSLDLKLKPDSPSVSGTITRVVQGVKIYPYQK